MLAIVERVDEPDVLVASGLGGVLLDVVLVPGLPVFEECFDYLF